MLLVIQIVVYLILDVLSRRNHKVYLHFLRFMTYSYRREGFMAPYHHSVNTHKRTKRARRVRKAAIFSVLFVGVIVAIIAVDWVLNKMSTSNTVVSRETTSAVQSADISVYRTEFYQFQAPESWVFVQNESNQNKFVYLNNQSSLVTQKLTIFVNRADLNREADFNVTRVVPVEVTGDKRFSRVTDISSHCNDSFPQDGNRDPRRITHNDVSFICSPDSQQFNIHVGLYKGTESVPATLNDGRQVKFVIVYEDLTAYPGPGDLYNIISSFQIF
jgi:uncharacterized protein (UPF0333 family)